MCPSLFKNRPIVVALFQHRLKKMTGQSSVI